MNSVKQKLILAAALAGIMLAAPAGAAMKMTEALDGTWRSPTESGRGILVDYIPFDDGTGEFFAATFTFNEGEPTWLTFQGTFLEHEFSKEVGVFQTTGGSFGFPWPGVTTEQVGTAVVTLHSCERMAFDLSMDPDSGFEDVLLDVKPLGNLFNEQCVYRQEFQGCPNFASEVPGLPRTCALNGNYLNQDLVLSNEITWLLDGLVRIGDDNANQSTVTIEPGTLLIGGGGTADYLYISPGSRIFANGLPHAPIVLTSDQDGVIAGTTPQPGDVGGLVISGNAPCNAAPEAPFNCFSEFDQTQRFGGDDPDDSSGEVTYFQVRYAGIEFQPNAEVNSFTMQGVGRGTRLSHLQAYRGQDDGIEFFGGTVNVKHMVVTEGGDDAIDWDLGWSGKMQYALVVHGEGFGEDHGFESANNPDNFDALPRATPIISNFTLLGNNQGGDGIRFKEGTAGQVWNTVVQDFAASCLNLTDGATYAAAGTPQQPTGDTVFAGVILDCDTVFLSDDGAPYTSEAFFNAFPGNAVASPLLDGFQPQPGSPARSGGLQIPDDDFFDYTLYRGAFDGDNDWTAGWTHQVLGGQ